MGNCGFGSAAEAPKEVSPYKNVDGTSAYTPPAVPPAGVNKSAGPFYCEECKQLITSANILLNEVVEVAGKKWHQNCFTCNRCKKAIAGKLVNIEGKRFCETCGKQQRDEKRPMCAKCNKRLVGDMVSELNQQWHKACFTCSDCNKVLDSFVPYNNKPYCAECARKTQARKNSNPPLPDGRKLSVSRGQSPQPRSASPRAVSPRGSSPAPVRPVSPAGDLSETVLVSAKL